MYYRVSGKVWRGEDSEWFFYYVEAADEDHALIYFLEDALGRDEDEDVMRELENIHQGQPVWDDSAGRVFDRFSVQPTDSGSEECPGCSGTGRVSAWLPM